MARKVGDLLGIGLLLISIWVFFKSLEDNILILKTIGVVGAIITFIVEVAFLISYLKLNKYGG